MKNPVIEATKAILFEDCGSAEGWEDNLNLGESAIKALDESSFPALDAPSWAELYRLRAESVRSDDGTSWRLVAASTRASLADAQTEIARLRGALEVAHDHIDMHSLEISHCKDFALIRDALK